MRLMSLGRVTPSWVAACASVRSMASLSRCVRGRCRCCGEVVDGLADLAVNLDIGAAHGEAFGVWAFVADAQDGGDAPASVGPMHCDVQREVEAHVEAQHAASAYQFEYALFVLDFKAAVFAVCVGALHLIAGTARIERAVGNLFDEVGQSEVHFLVVLQGQRVAIAAQFDDKNALRCAALYLETER